MRHSLQITNTVDFYELLYDVVRDAKEHWVDDNGLPMSKEEYELMEQFAATLEHHIERWRLIERIFEELTT